MNKTTLTTKIATASLLISALAFVTACPEKKSDNSMAIAAVALAAGGGLPSGSSVTPDLTISSWAQLDGAVSCNQCHPKPIFGWDAVSAKTKAGASFCGNAATAGTSPLVTTCMPGGKMYLKDAAACNGAPAKLAGWVANGCNP